MSLGVRRRVPTSYHNPLKTLGVASPRNSTEKGFNLNYDADATIRRINTRGVGQRDPMFEVMNLDAMRNFGEPKTVKKAMKDLGMKK